MKSLLLLLLLLGPNHVLQSAEEAKRDLASIEAELEIDQALLQRDLSEVRLKKLEDLKSKGLASETELKRAKATHRIATANFENSKKVFHLIDSRETSEEKNSEKTKFKAVPGLSLRVGALGFGFLRVPEMESTRENTSPSLNDSTLENESNHFLRKLHEKENLRLAKLQKIQASPYEQLTVSAGITEIEMHARAAHYRSLLLSQIEENADSVSLEGSEASHTDAILRNHLWVATGDPSELAATLTLTNLLANSTVEQEIARCVIELNQLRLEQKRALEAKGYASPLEVEKARLNLIGAKANLQEAVEAQRLHQINRELVRELTAHDLDPLAIPAPPQSMSEAIEHWEAIFADCTLGNHREIGEAAHLGLLAQLRNVRAISRLHEQCELLAWKLDRLEQINSTHDELLKTRINWRKAEAVLRYWEQKTKETHCHLLQLAAIANTEERLAAIGKNRDQEALPYSTSLAKNLTRFHEAKASSESHLMRAEALQAFHDWHHSLVSRIHAADPDHPELARATLEREKATLIQDLALEDIGLAKAKAATSLAMQDSVEAKGSPLSILDLHVSVRDRLAEFDQYRSRQNAEVQLAGIYVTRSRERFAQLQSLKQRGLASQEELENGALAADWAQTGQELAIARNAEQGEALQQIAAFFNDSETRQLSSVESE